jgi:hypothetical protein
MKKMAAVWLVFIAIGLALDLLRIEGNVPRALFFAAMLGTMGWVASREFGSRRPPSG